MHLFINFLKQTNVVPFFLIFCTFDLNICKHYAPSMLLILYTMNMCSSFFSRRKNAKKTLVRFIIGIVPKCIIFAEQCII